MSNSEDFPDELVLSGKSLVSWTMSYGLYQSIALKEERFNYPTFSFSGKNYMHKQVLIIEKDEKVWLIYCYYTDKGIANRDKYRKGIESFVKFH